MNNCWLFEASFQQLVESSWASCNIFGWKAYVVKEKFRILKEKIKVWNKDVFQKFDSVLLQLKESISAIDIVVEKIDLSSEEIGSRKSMVADMWIKLRQ
jgi:hypothetical protein